MDLEAIFVKHCTDLYANLRSRHAAKYNITAKQAQRTGRQRRITRMEIRIPFTRSELIELVRKQWFRGNVNQPIPCIYCRGWIDAGSFSIDHYHSWRQTKDSRFENLRACCQLCNELKGDFDGDMFDRLRRVMDEAVFGIRCRDGVVVDLMASEVRNVWSLMRMGWGYKRSAFMGRANVAKKKEFDGQMILEEEF